MKDWTWIIRTLALAACTVGGWAFVALRGLENQFLRGAVAWVVLMAVTAAWMYLIGEMED